MPGGYYFTGSFHSDKLQLSAGEITQGIYHQREQKVKVIIMSSRVIQTQRLNIVLWGADKRHKKDKTRDSCKEKSVDGQKVNRNKIRK